MLEDQVLRSLVEKLGTPVVSQASPCLVDFLGASNRQGRS